MSPRAKVLLWAVVSLLPLVDGAHMGAGSSMVGAGPDSGRAVGLSGGREERRLPIALPEAAEEEDAEEERQEGGESQASWHALYDPYVTDEADDHPGDRWAAGRRPPRSPSSSPAEPPPKGLPQKKKKRRKKEREGEKDRGGVAAGAGPRQSTRDCRVERKEMRVRDLGLGFDSDEIVLFKFCVGSCEAARTNYDLALRALLRNGSLPRRITRKVSGAPCCRPDRFEPVSFMDTQATWRTIKSMSAASCMCMG